MPIYGYRCKFCDHTFEVMQSVNDEPIKECPECKGPVGKIFFPVGIAFKGSGFYVNDHKSPKRIAAEKSTSGCSTCTSAGTCSSD
ncbi:MAG: FmdB family transcriptional regulator [Candidatus Aquicultor secundus]|uniref:FmdB family transcriptional regulator n=1 Tax=Candidatus Aquicultor secundus TaxID=1973895 RepID=A0A2M7T9S0_9ACTN|nr:FmdB family zinc ribbon protein [Candidatus Aquicultor secundus]NCO65007.1 zinc ribbon domain-containing protein [Solirubrobacter sp.]OIO88634.1 MAG: hypothetical protein AUK32_01070 [Candidatus Aquicultor secundus]PIU28028.1 MAG: FmdB family transcriptional regulator [Candidatus Aquicultor secundus]PIW22842.1 MAG: FmdB family transcriptional regulator [Candidatus Aquicultor secundus]PIX51603.1 MAG: FmdB family transcriptional regulator [Candidatus Aquicultor secundus]